MHRMAVKNIASKFFLAVGDSSTPFEANSDIMKWRPPIRQFSFNKSKTL